MIKVLAYPLSVFYYICFGLTLVVFHAIQWVCFNIFGYKAHKLSVDWLQFFLMRCLNILGTRFSFNNSYDLPANTPLIIVANHQSTYDIPPLIWYFRKHHPKFISKKELGKGIPSVSYNLRHGGSVLIDRKDPRRSIKDIITFAKRVEENNWSAVIFPEGTRSRTGTPKPFKKKGLLTLIENMPTALVVPVSINNSWKTMRYGHFPMGIGAHIKFQAHQPLEVNQASPNELILSVEQTIANAIKNDR